MAQNPFTVVPGGNYGPGLRGLSDVVGEIGERNRKEEADQKAVEKFATMKAGAMEAYRSGDPDTIAEFSLANPEMAQALSQTMGFKNKQTEQNYQDSLFDFYQNPTEQNVTDLVEARQELLQGQGVGPEGSQETGQFIQKYAQDPEGTHKAIGAELAFRYPKKWKSMQGAGTKRDKAAVDLQLEDDLAKQYVSSGLSKTDARLAAKKEILGNDGKGGDKSFAPDPLTKLFNQIDALPEDSPRREVYQRAIDKLTTDSNPELEMVIAQRIVDGKLDFNTLSRRGGQKGRIAGIIAEIAPDFNLIDAAANIKYKTDPANLKSIALIAGIEPLFEELKGKAADLENGVIPIFNKGINFWKRQTGEAKIVAFDNLRDDVIAETERVLLGSGVLSDSKYQRALHNLNSAQSPEQMGAAIQQMELVVQKREEALREQPYPQGEIPPGEKVKTIFNPVTGERMYLRNGKWENS